MINWLFATIYM